MLKGDISRLSSMCNCSEATIYRVAKSIGIDLSRVRGRCDKTVDYLSGMALEDEHQIWLEKCANAIIEHRKSKQSTNRKKQNGGEKKIKPIQLGFPSLQDMPT